MPLQNSNMVTPGSLRESLSCEGTRGMNVTAPGGTTFGVIKAEPGRLVRIVVTTAMSAAATFFDNPNANNSGNALMTVPATAAAGTIYDVQAPAQNGISYSMTGTGVLFVTID